MSLPVLPSAQQMTPALVRDYSAQVVAWAEQSDDIAQVRDMSNKWAAITEYVRRTSRDGIVEAEAALRRLEVRVGVLEGQAQLGRPRGNVPREEHLLSRKERSYFRSMAEHSDVVEEVIAQSTDDDPPSRRKVLKAIKRAKAQAIATRPAGLGHFDGNAERPTAFPTIVIDPPWRYDNVATRGAAEDHYPTMSQDELLAMVLPAAPDAHLYLWVTNSFIDDGFDLMRAWGFTYKTCLTWCKPQIGMGNYFRSTTEHVLFGVRGKQPTLRNDVPTHFVADRRRHSQKPESFYDLVESCSPGPYLEMFARRERIGWNAWGNELGDVA
jgi:N6-adenosine-specific RNA methylase IME4